MKRLVTIALLAGAVAGCARKYEDNTDYDKLREQIKQNTSQTEQVLSERLTDLRDTERWQGWARPDLTYTGMLKMLDSRTNEIRLPVTYDEAPFPDLPLYANFVYTNSTDNDPITQRVVPLEEIQMYAQRKLH